MKNDTFRILQERESSHSEHCCGIEQNVKMSIITMTSQLWVDSEIGREHKVTW